MKRGFVGPSIFPLCLGDYETQNHLLNLCSYSSQIWDQCAIVMRATNRNREGLKETIEGWRDLLFTLPSSTAFGSYFQVSSFGSFGKSGTCASSIPLILIGRLVWKQIHDNIRETIHLQPWKDEDLICPPHEQVHPGQLEYQLQPLSFQEPSEIPDQGKPFSLVSSASRIYQVKL
jgi:hypothetical protein